jgi:hypothetical protein
VPDPARVLRRRRSPLLLALGGVLVALVVVVEALILQAYANVNRTTAVFGEHRSSTAPWGQRRRGRAGEPPGHPRLPGRPGLPVRRPLDAGAMTELLAKSLADSGFYLPAARPVGSLSEVG